MPLLQAGDKELIAFFYVDEIILVSSSVPAADHLLSALRSDFAVKDLGKLHYFLGLEVAHTSDGLYLTEKKYSLDLLRHAGMLKCNPSSTPISATDKITAVDGDLLFPNDATEYHSLVGGLQYLTITRADIAFVVNRVCSIYKHLGIHIVRRSSAFFIMFA
nr:uncharacterized mitochondrial protein AtMg00810-like [Aegilops tauschii subsp. strangulata]